MIDPLERFGRKAMQFAEGDKVILCEGRDECEVLERLTRNWNPRPQIGTRDDAGGRRWDEELRGLAQQVAIRRISAIGLVFDAEPSRRDKVNELAQWYRYAGLTMPATGNKLRFSEVDGTKVRTAYLINPSGRPTGCLETLFLQQVRASEVGKCVTALLKCYAKHCPCGEHLSKVEVRSFIAYWNAYHTGLGVAIRDEHLDCTGPEFDGLRRFVELLASV